ncbi:RICIN domain-containing protein [Sphingomonas sp. LT1P40]|uniref:RICIN domain-containing protein n=1 Tax=Alteristakelama amylovorans TaxID=3096166 RepID=UPI002FC816DE
MARRVVTLMLIVVAALVTAFPAMAQQELRSSPIPETGTAEYIFSTAKGDCLVAQVTVRPGVAPYLREGRCDNPVVLTLHYLGRSEVRIEVGTPGQCATVARWVVFGDPRIDIHPCNGALDQRFRLERATRGMRVRTLEGACWTRRGPSYGAPEATDLGSLICRNGALEQMFSLAPPPDAETRPARVPQPAMPSATPAPAPAMPVATPVTPVTPAPEPRPATLPANAPLPGFYALETRDPPQCLGIIGLSDDPDGTNNRRIRMSQCENRWTMNFEMRFIAGRGFLIVPQNEPDVCATLPRMASEPRRPWVAAAQCTVADDQLFVIEQIGFGNFVTIKTLAGLCLTVRGNLRAESSADNNTGLFPEPCRSTTDQNFKLGWIERR